MRFGFSQCIRRTSIALGESTSVTGGTHFGGRALALSTKLRQAARIGVNLENQYLSVRTIWSLACDDGNYIGVLMSDVLPTAHHEFWRPPVVNGAIPISSGLAEVCKGCGAEFMIGSYFCHLCGTDRRTPLAAVNL